MAKLPFNKGYRLLNPLKVVKKVVKVVPKKLKPQPTLRDKVVHWAKWGAANEPRIHYAEVRPIPLKLKPGTTPLTTDCSGFVTLCYKWAGAPDPNGNAFNGQGFTGTLVKHGKLVTTPRPADWVVYGPGNGEHTALVIEGGSDPTLVSLGEERGPVVIKNSVERTYHSPPVRYFSILN